jgi:ElaB/YqjD/DUF883 family membrane-anchored ribosome-binding protein
MSETKLKTVHNDIHTLITEAQDLLREAATATAAKADELRTKAMTLLESATDKAQAVQSTAIASSKELITNTDDYVNQNPWRAIAIATTVGLIAGLVVARCSK